MKQFVSAGIVAVVVFVTVSGVQVHRFLSAPDRVEQALGVKTPGDSSGSSLLRNVEIYPGYARVEIGGVAGNPETWIREWYRLSDVTFEGSYCSRVRWEGGQVSIEHQQPLSRHRSLAAEIIAANVWNLMISPALWALVIGFFSLLVLSSRETDRLHRKKRSMERRLHA